MATYSMSNKLFENITGNKLNNASLLKLFNILKDDKDYYLNIFRFYNINDTVYNDLLNYYTVESEEEEYFDLLADDAYDNVNLWWIICLINDVINPFEELEPGKNVVIIKQFLIPYILREIKTISEK